MEQFRIYDVSITVVVAIQIRLPSTEDTSYGNKAPSTQDTISRTVKLASSRK